MLIFVKFIVTKVDSFPMPLIADALDSLAGASVFSVLDLKSGFWQIQMQEDSKQQTAFATHNGLYEFLTIPFGLVHSGAKEDYQVSRISHRGCQGHLPSPLAKFSSVATLKIFRVVSSNELHAKIVRPLSAV